MDHITKSIAAAVVVATIFSCSDNGKYFDLTPCDEAFAYNRKVDISTATKPYMKTCGLRLSTSRELHDSYGQNISVNQQILDDIYDEVDITDRFFTENNIPYYAVAGTLLGIVRNGGLIPNDDDADIAVDTKYASKIDELISKFDQAGYRLTRDKLGFKVYKKNSGSMGLDIFLTKVRTINGKDVMAYESEWAFHHWPTEWVEIASLNDLVRVPFGHLQITAPKMEESIAFLDRAYGQDWYSITYKMYNHIEQKQVKKEKENLLPTEYYHLVHSTTFK